jgi:hypothetical protein
MPHPCLMRPELSDAAQHAMTIQLADFPEVTKAPPRAETYKGVQVLRHDPCGVEVLNVDLAQPIADGTFRAVMDIWHQGLVICFRNQDLAAEDQLRFGRRVGELSVIHTPEFTGEDPSIMYISNVKKNGEFVHALPIGGRDDVPYRPVLPAAAGQGDDPLRDEDSEDRGQYLVLRPPARL